MTLSGKVSLKVKMTILIIEILIIGLYGVVVGAKNMGAIRNDAIASMEEYVSEEHPEYSQEEIQQELQPILQKMQQEKKAKQDQFFYFMVIMCILTDIWVLYLTFDITSGVKRSALFAKKMGQGDFTQRVEEKYLKREDEIGILARSIRDIHHMDLPGIYSLRPYTQEEIVSRDFILNQKPDGMINIVDATNIERNLYLTLQLLELRIPMVLALNMMDEVRSNGGSIDVQKMSAALGIPVIPIAAAKGEGVSELVDQAIAVARSKTLPKVTDFCADDSAVHRCIHAVTHLIADHADRIGVPARFCATKLIEGGDDLANRLALDRNERELLEHCIVQMESEAGLDRNAALADMRYTFIESVVASSVVKCHESREHARSMKIDRFLTGRYTALPAFLAVMLLLFYLTFHVIGQRLSDWLAVGIGALTAMADHALTAYGIEYNTELTDMYKDFQPGREYAKTLKSRPEQSGRLYEPDISNTTYYTQSMLDNAKNFSDTAIVVIGRLAGESNDATKQQYKRTEKGGDIVGRGPLRAASGRAGADGGTALVQRAGRKGRGPLGGPARARASGGHGPHPHGSNGE